MVVVTQVLSILYILYKSILILGVMLLIGTILYLVDMIKELKDNTLKGCLVISIIANILWIIDIIIQIIAK